MNMAERIRERRRVLGFSQAKLAELIEVSCITIRRWEAGERNPNASVIPKLAEILNTSVAYLMGLEDAPVSRQETPESPSREPEKEPPASPEVETRGTLSYTFSNGEKLEVPATPEYAEMFREMVTQRLNSQGAGIQAV